MKLRVPDPTIHFERKGHYLEASNWEGGIMSVQMLAHAVSDTLVGSTGHEADAPYTLAFMSSTVVEVIAVAVIFAMLAVGLARSIFRSSAISDRWLRFYRALDVFKLYKMIIPLGCLVATGWIWNLIQGA
jgi:hypothetical protein